MNAARLIALALGAYTAGGFAAHCQAEDIGKYGFRVDPMEWVKNEKSLKGAQVRAFVFKQTTEADRELIDAEIKKLLAEQKEDGSFVREKEGKTHKVTHDRVQSLLDLGVSPKRPEVQRAADSMLREGLVQENGDPRRHVTAVLCRAGRANDEAVKASLQRIMGLVPRRLGKACPWAELIYLDPLFAGREYADTEPVITKSFEWAHRSMNAAGAISYKDRRAWIRATGRSDQPLARQLLIRLIPTILRTQKADGGFSWHSFGVFSALKEHGLLEPLRKLPPLPADWKVVRSIPAPADELSAMTWGGGQLWLCRAKSDELFAASPKDGKVVTKLKLPFDDAAGIGWWDDSLLVTRNKAKLLLWLDPKTGEVQRTFELKKMEWIGDPVRVGDEVRVTDHYMAVFRSVRPDKPESLGWRHPPGALSDRACFAGDGIWHVDAWTPTIIKSSPDGKLLDWGEQPFDAECKALAWDGSSLWALDAKGRRLCIIEKSETGRMVTEHLAAVREARVKVEAEPFRVDHARFQQGVLKIKVSNTGRVPVRVSLSVYAPKAYRVSPTELAVEVPAGDRKTAEVTMARAASYRMEVLPAFKLDWSATFPLRDGTTHAARGELTCDALARITIPRLGALKDLDALRDALKDLAPQTVRREARTVRQAGKAVGDLRIAVAGDHLAVLARSFDPRCRADAPEWKGCNLDVYVAKPGKPTIRQFVFFATSPKGEGRLEPWEVGKKRTATDFPWRVVPVKPFGYEVHALIPLSECLLDPDVGEFLIDMAVVTPPEPGEKPQFTLLHTGDSSRCAFRNNRYYALAVVKEGD